MIRGEMNPIMGPGEARERIKGIEHLYGIKILNKARDAETSRLRTLVFIALKELHFSYAAIGRITGRNHSTVIKALQKSGSELIFQYNHELTAIRSMLR